MATIRHPDTGIPINVTGLLSGSYSLDGLEVIGETDCTGCTLEVTLGG